MIRSFRCRKTQAIWRGDACLDLPADIQGGVRRKLRMLNNSQQLQDLRVPPNNRLEALKGDRKGQFSIRVNQKWRICFRWLDGAAYDVEVVDYH
ncbi:MAG: type II toxin-antitoxin system RelE/ParE family toxin [Deltaproteobacteria bacterium]|nr:type II toxin-antitoxin system RelE/ParE family toxin [Deltaproteobacteria bacterium]